MVHISAFPSLCSPGSSKLRSGRKLWAIVFKRTGISPCDRFQRCVWPVSLQKLPSYQQTQQVYLWNINLDWVTKSLSVGCSAVQTRLACQTCWVESRLVSGSARCIFWTVRGLPYPVPSVCRLPAGQPSGWGAGHAGGRICYLLLRSGGLLFQISLVIFN